MQRVCGFYSPILLYFVQTKFATMSSCESATSMNTHCQSPSERFTVLKSFKLSIGKYREVQKTLINTVMDYVWPGR